MSTNPTTTKSTKARKLGAVRILLGIAAVTAALMVAPATADARVGDSKSIPSFNGTGSIDYTSYWGGTAHFNNTGTTCIYVQYQYVAVLGLDSSWHRLTSNDCGGAAGNESFSKPTSRGFNGMAFKLCKDVPNATDPCGSKVTIYN